MTKIKFPDVRTRVRIYQGTAGIIGLVGGTALSLYCSVSPVQAIPAAILFYLGVESLIGAVREEFYPIYTRITKCSGF